MPRGKQHHKNPIQHDAKTLLALLLATLAPCSFAKQYWVKGVDTTGGWVDVDKARNQHYNEFENEVRVGANKGSSGYFDNDRSTGDGFLCWAASATNILTWWHRQNPGAAQTNKKAPVGKKKYGSCSRRALSMIPALRKRASGGT